METGMPKLNAEKVLAAEEQRTAAMLAADVDALGQILADGMVWFHSSGAKDDKASLLEQFGNGTMRCFDVKRSDFEVHIHGETAITTGMMEIDVQIGTVRKSSQSRFMAVWIQIEGNIRLAGWQSSRIPAA